MEKESVWKAGKERQSGDLKLGMHWHWRPEFLFAFGTAHPVTPQVYPHIRQSTSTHTLFALEDDPRRPGLVKRTPSKELLTPTPLTFSLPPTQLPKSTLPPSLWPYQPTCTSHNMLELASHIHWELRNPGLPTGHSCSHIGWERLRSVTDPLTCRMSKASRLARPPSAGVGSKLPSPRRECPGTDTAAGRARVLTVGEKLMRAGSDGILSRQKPLAAAVPQDKSQSETQAETQAPIQSPGEKGQNMEIVLPKSRISPPKASSQQQGAVHSK